MSDTGSFPHVVVIGGGLAGLSAAVACADRGLRVTLFERRSRLGGATWSFERNGRWFDNGQHVFLRCCDAYRQFLVRLGVADRAPIQDGLALPVLRPAPNGPVVSWLRRDRLPAPLQLVPSLLSYKHLDWRERFLVARGMAALRRLRLSDELLDSETMADFLRRNGQTNATIERLFDLITLPTVNLHAADASLLLGAKVFSTAFFGEADAADIGWASIPLGELHGISAAETLDKLGASVRCRARVSTIACTDPAPRAGEPERAKGVIVDGELVEADAVVLAVPHEEAAELLPPSAGVDRSAVIQLGVSPIIDVHVVYDRRVSDYPLASAIESPVQFVFDRTSAAGMSPDEGQCLSVSVSAAFAEEGERPEVLIDRYTKALADLFPKASRAKVLDAVVSREHSATFRAVPGTARLRPPQATAIANLTLAGAWVATNWPATMEGAVRSGNVAAANVLRELGRSRSATELEEVVA